MMIVTKFYYYYDSRQQRHRSCELSLLLSLLLLSMSSLLFIHLPALPPHPNIQTNYCNPHLRDAVIDNSAHMNDYIDMMNELESVRRPAIFP